MKAPIKSEYSKAMDAMHKAMGKAERAEFAGKPGEARMWEQEAEYHLRRAELYTLRAGR